MFVNPIVLGLIGGVIAFPVVGVFPTFIGEGFNQNNLAPHLGHLGDNSDV